MSEWKCRDCGAGVRRFDLQCRPCADKNTTELDAARRIALAAPALLAACVEMHKELRWLAEHTDALDEKGIARALHSGADAIARARGGE